MASFGNRQILDKTFKCMTCGGDIKLQRKDDDSGWNRYNLDGTPHIDQKRKKEQQQQQPQPEQQQQQVDVSKEITAVKAQLLILINRLEYIE